MADESIQTSYVPSFIKRFNLRGWLSDQELCVLVSKEGKGRKNILDSKFSFHYWDVAATLL